MNTNSYARLLISSVRACDFSFLLFFSFLSSFFVRRWIYALLAANASHTYPNRKMKFTSMQIFHGAKIRCLHLNSESMKEDGMHCIRAIIGKLQHSSSIVPVAWMWVLRARKCMCDGSFFFCSSNRIIFACAIRWVHPTSCKTAKTRNLSGLSALSSHLFHCLRRSVRECASAYKKIIANWMCLRLIRTKNFLWNVLLLRLSSAKAREQSCVCERR